MTQTVILTQPVRVAGSVLDAGTTQALADDIAADLVARGFATSVGTPAWQSPAQNMARVIAQSNIPFLIPPGDGGANGLTFTGTAGAFTLSAAIVTSSGSVLANCYAYFSANFGGSTLAAGWYFTKFSSDTAGIVYADRYFGGSPVIPASPTPIGVNLTGRITSTTNEVDIRSDIVIPADALGKNGIMSVKMHTNGSTAGTKTYRMRDVATTTQMLNYAPSSSQVANQIIDVVCHGNHSVKSYKRTIGSSSASMISAAYSVDTSVAVVCSLSIQQSTNLTAPILETIHIATSFGE